MNMQVPRTTPTGELASRGSTMWYWVAATHSANGAVIGSLPVRAYATAANALLATAGTPPGGAGRAWRANTTPSPGVVEAAALLAEYCTNWSMITLPNSEFNLRLFRMEAQTAEGTQGQQGDMNIPSKS